MEISHWYDQTHPDAKIERIAGFRGDEEDEPKKVNDSRKHLNKARKRMLTDELSDNDDVYGEDGTTRSRYVRPDATPGTPGHFTSILLHLLV
jgi:hypothetical protein